MALMDVWQQAKGLPVQERKELMKMLLDTLPADSPVSQPKTGADVVALLATMDPIVFVDEEIEDPVEWVKAQRRKEAARLEHTDD